MKVFKWILAIIIGFVFTKLFSAILGVLVWIILVAALSYVSYCGLTYIGNKYDIDIFK